MLKEIAKAKAEEEAMRKIEEEKENLSAVLKSETLIQDVKQNPAPKIEPVESNTPKNEHNLDPGAPTFVPLRKLDTSQSKGSNAVQSPSVENTGAEPPIKTEELSSVVQLIAEQQQMSLLPVQRPPVFSGNYFDYATFITAFESLIECRVTDPKQRLYYLNQHTAGDAKESIKGLITLDSTDSYEKARKVLKERFGHPYRVAKVYMEKLNSWPAIREGDGASLQQFSDFLVLCEQAMKTLKYMEGLNSEDTLRKVTSKLPSTVGIRWCRLANKMLRYEERLASFHDVVDFVKDEAALATDPVFSPDALKEAGKNESTSNSGSNVKNTMWRNNGKEGNQSATSFSTNATPQGEKSPPRSPSCPFCNSYHHHLDNCPNFAKKTIEERRLFVQEARLCFGCLCLGHVSNDAETERCASRAVFPIQRSFMMKQRAPLRLMKAQQVNKLSELLGQKKPQAAAQQVRVMQPEPSTLHHRTNPERQVVVYALLDPASNGTFIKERILEDLQVDGTETQLQLNTMHRSEVVPTRRITGLNVESMGKDARVELPKTYTRDDIPSKREEIPRPETAKVWPRLSGIASKLYPYQEDVEVGLLIGSNCPSAIKPKEVIPGRSTDPYAIRTLLGWGIIGPISGGSNKENSDLLCHRVAVRGCQWG